MINWLKRLFCKHDWNITNEKHEKGKYYECDKKCNKCGKEAEVFNMSDSYDRELKGKIRGWSISSDEKGRPGIKYYE